MNVFDIERCYQMEYCGIMLYLSYILTLKVLVATIDAQWEGM